MGSFLITTLHILNLVWINHYLHKRGGSVISHVQFDGFEAIYNEPSASSQTQSNLPSEIHVFVDGNIYSSDKQYEQQNASSEVMVLEAYKRYGIEFSKYLDGEYSLVVVDPRHGKMVISTDPMGLKPLFVAWQHEIGKCQGWGVSSLPSALQRMNLGNISKVRSNTYQVWNFSENMQCPIFWYEGAVYQWDERPVKISYKDWDNALIQAIKVRSTQHAFDNFGIPTPGLAGMVGRSLLSAVSKVEDDGQSAFNFILKNPGVMDLCYNMTGWQEPWNPALFGNIKYLAQVSTKECIYYEGFENGILLSDLGAELYFGTSKLADLSDLALLHEMHYLAISREIVLGSFSVDIRSPFLAKNVIEEWLQLHPTLKLMSNMRNPFEKEECKYHADENSQHSDQKRSTSENETDNRVDYFLGQVQYDSTISSDKRLEEYEHIIINSQRKKGQEKHHTSGENEIGAVKEFDEYQQIQTHISQTHGNKPYHKLSLSSQDDFMAEKDLVLRTTLKEILTINGRDWPADELPLSANQQSSDSFQELSDLNEEGWDWEVGLAIDPAAKEDYDSARRAFQAGDQITALQYFRRADVLEPASPSKVRLTFMQAFMGPEMAFSKLSVSDQQAVVALLKEIEEDDKATPSFRRLSRYALGNTLFAMGKVNEASGYLQKEVTLPLRMPPKERLPLEGNADQQPIVMAVATKETDELNNLRDSASSAGVELAILGAGLPTYESWLKLPLYLKFLEELPPDQLVVGVDAYDVLLMPNLHNLSQVYLQLGCEILVGVETVSWPDASAALLYAADPPGLKDPKRRFLNSGNFAGTARALASMMTTAIQYDSHDDQRAFVKYYLEHQETVCLDYGSQVFLTLYGLSNDIHMHPPDGQAWFPHLKTHPMVLHGNGRGGQKIYRRAVELWNKVSLEGVEQVLFPDPFNVAAERYEAGYWAQAAAAFLAKLQDDPTNLDARLNLGLTLIRMERYEVALQVFQEILDVWSPGHPAAFLHAGVCTLRLGRRQEAINYWSEGLKSNPFYTKLRDALKSIPEAENL